MKTPKRLAPVLAFVNPNRPQPVRFPDLERTSLVDKLQMLMLLDPVGSPPQVNALVDVLLEGLLESEPELFATN